MRDRFLRYLADLPTPYSRSSERQAWDRVREPKNRLLQRAGLQIGDHVAIAQGFFREGFGKNILINDYAVIGVGFSAHSFSTIRIGKFGMIATSVSVSNGGHDVETYEPQSGHLEIGNGCWIGTGARIVGALRIGDNSVIGAPCPWSCRIW